jgi:hypothetical protein
MAATNYYDDLFSRLIGDGVPLPAVIERVAGAYLDGKPLPAGKEKKLTKRERDILFWASDVVKGCPPDAWGGEADDARLGAIPGTGACGCRWIGDAGCARGARGLDSRRQARWARLEPAISTTSRTGSGCVGK